MTYEIENTKMTRKETDSYQLREARRYAHTVFDKLWKTSYQRTQAYAWLAQQMRLAVRDCHIAVFDLAQCHEVVRLVRTLQPVIQDRDPSEKRFERRRRQVDEFTPEVTTAN